MDFTLKSEFNRVTQAKRQPGSAFKPIVYAAALNEFSPNTIILDALSLKVKVLAKKLEARKTMEKNSVDHLLLKSDRVF